MLGQKKRVVRDSCFSHLMPTNLMPTNLMPVLLLGLVSSLGPSVDLFIYVAQRLPDSEACDAYCTQRPPMLTLILHTSCLLIAYY